MKNKKQIILVIVIFLLIVSAMLFLLGERNETNEKKVIKEEPIKVIKKEELKDFNFDGKLYVDIEKNLKEDGLKFKEGFKFDENHYLVLVRHGGNYYTDANQASGLYWITYNKGKIEKQNLLDQTKIIQVITEDESPYIRSKKETYLVFHELEGTREKLEKSKGYVYSLEKNGKIERIYKTEGIFEGIIRDEEKNMILVEKTYQDEFNAFPSFLKPFLLEYKRVYKGNWVVIKTEKYEPKLKISEGGGEEVIYNKIEMNE